MKSPEQYAEEFIISEFPEAKANEVFLLRKGYLAGFQKGEDLRMQRISPYEYIIGVISSYQNIPIEIMKQKTRKQEIVFARQLCYYFGKKSTNLSLYMLSKPFDQDHATALHGIQVIDNLIFTDRNMRTEINEIKGKIEEKLK